MGKDKKKNLKKNENKDWPDEPNTTQIISTEKKEPEAKDEKKTKRTKPSFDAAVHVSPNESDNSDIEILTLEQQGKSRNKEKTFKGGFDLLAVEDEDFDMDDQDSNCAEKKSSKGADNPEKIAKPNGTSGKKSKKKDRKKKRDEDDEDIDKILEELTLEMTGSKPKEDLQQPKNIETVITDLKPEEKSDKKKKKKLKEKIPEENVENKELSPDVVEGETSTVKTAAEKKKAKKEREKIKKLAEFEQQASKKKIDTELSKQPTSIQKNKEVETEDLEELNDEEKDEVSDKKKKKKKVEEDEKKDKKRPGKKAIAAMQEALKKVKEEEERQRLEEEARIVAEEEAERKKEEKLRLEQEKKEKKKQKEKEKRERLKAEGKLLTKTQRQNRARMEATLEVLRQQGVEIPQVGEKKPQGSRLGDRKKFIKKKPSVPDVENVVSVVEPEISVTVDAEDVAGEVVSDEDMDDTVKDAWDESSDEDDQKLETLPKGKTSPGSALKERKHSAETEESSSDSEEESEKDAEESSDSEDEAPEATPIEAVRLRIKRRREVAEAKRSLEKLRSPVVCVLGHVDTGKTKILDKIRSTHVQDGEAGGITQQIGATMVPQEALREQCKMVKNFNELELKVPGLLIIDTPGHESFSNLRSRGSSLCDIAILVVDITHGLEPQTIESINLLKQKKTPFVVALNKIDRIYEWKPMKNKDVFEAVKSQSKSTKQFFEDRVQQVILEFATQSLNAVLYYENKDQRSYISMVPTSALTGDGMGNLMSIIVEISQNMMAKRLQYSEDIQATVLEVKAIGGLGHTMDIILVNGRLREGDTIVFAGYDGAMTTQIRALLMPQPLKEIRVKTQFIEHKEIDGAQGIKLTGKDLEKAIAGLPLLVPCRADEIPVLKEEITAAFKEALNTIKVTSVGVYVQASTLGSLEALMEFLSTSKIPVCGVRIGPVTKRDVMKCSVMLEHGPLFAVILAFDVKIEKEAQDLADYSNIKIFHANIIYHLFDMYTNYSTELKEKDKEQFKNEAVFPCKLRILPQFIFNTRDPIIIGVSVEAGCVKQGTPLCVPSKEFLEIGIVTTIESNHKAMEVARKGQEICIKIEPSGGDAPKMFGRHFEETDMLVSKISRNSIDMCKKYFRDELQKSDWQLMLELKNTFAIV